MAKIPTPALSELQMVRKVSGGANPIPSKPLESNGRNHVVVAFVRGFGWAESPSMKSYSRVRSDAPSAFGRSSVAQLFHLSGYSRRLEDSNPSQHTLASDLLHEPEWRLGFFPTYRTPNLEVVALKGR
jgi:hypothetical protein